MSYLVAKKIIPSFDAACAYASQIFTKSGIVVAVVKIEANVPNLDAMDENDLVEFAQTYEIGRVKPSRVLFPSRPEGYTVAARHLGLYARNKSVAMQCRGRGDISNAQTYERICENIYKDLPDWARW